MKAPKLFNKEFGRRVKSLVRISHRPVFSPPIDPLLVAIAQNNPVIIVTQSDIPKRVEDDQ